MDDQTALVKRIKLAYADCDDDLVGPLDTKNKSTLELKILAWDLDIRWWTSKLRQDFRNGLSVGKAASTILPAALDPRFVDHLVRYINNEADVEFYVLTTWIGYTQILIPVPRKSQICSRGTNVS